MQQRVPFAEAKARKYPEQVAVAIARTESGRYNPITLGWAMQTSHEPPMWAISVGLTRYSCGVIRRAGAFVLALPSERQENEVLFFGTRSGRDVDKLMETGARIRPAERIDAVLLEDAVANFECRVVGELETGDHVIFAGEVVASHVNTEPLRRLYTVGPGYQMGGLGAEG